MKANRLIKSGMFWVLTLTVFIGGVLLCDQVQGEHVVVVPPVGLNPLNQVAKPEPPQLPIYVKNRSAAVRLGKAFFWDMQAGSDGLTACGTCHFHAGTDNRMKNTLNPGTRAGDTVFGNSNIPGVPGFPQFGPNYTLDPVNDFPLHQRGGTGELPTDPVVRHTNDVVGSAGVPLSDFTGVVLGSAVDSVVSEEIHPIFNVDGVNLRQVTGRNTPSVINAIFNFTNLWDGRASFIFNGENPFGPADPSAGVWFNEAGTLVKRPIMIQFASVASQAVGPPMDTAEMSGRGRTFPHLGRKMLSLVPLGRQLVHPQDSVLGLVSRAVQQPDGTYAGNGLTLTYAQMIQSAFEDRLWNSDLTVTIELPGGGTADFTHMEANFSMYWGLAIQLYVATLTSDETPFDHWLAGDEDAMTDLQKQGFQVFNGIGNCVICHVDTEFTSHSVAFTAFQDNVNNLLIELMFTSDGTQSIYDDGFINSAVTPTADDIGRGGTVPIVNPLTGQNFPLSFSALAKLQAQGLLPFQTPILNPIIPVNMPVNANGSFKTPGLRNIELTTPYFHNGSVMEIADVIDFYSRAGNFHQENIHDLDPVIGSGLFLIQGRHDLHMALESFLRALTDPRVLAKTAPFDHPEILIPEGYPEILTRIPATNFEGLPAPASLLSLNAVFSPTGTSSQVISGAVAAGLTPTVAVNTAAVVGPVTLNGTLWSAEITALELGNNVITVSVIDPNSVMTTVSETIVYVDTRPLITSTPATTVTAGDLYMYAIQETDTEGDITGYELVEGPEGMFIFPDWGLVLWLPTAAQVGAHPVTVQVNDLAGFQVQQSFTVTVASAVPTFSVAGRVTNAGAGLDGVTLTVTGAAAASAVADAGGNYTVTGLPNGTYTVTPSLEGYAFTPASRSVTVNSGNIAAQNFAGTPVVVGAGTYEAELAVLGGGAVTSTAASGYTGTGFVDYVGSTGESVEWTVTVPGAGTYKLEFRYALNGANRPLRISVNGTVVNPSMAFPSTGGWTTWGTVSMATTLSAGANTIRAMSIGSSGGNLDSLTVSPAFSGAFEAETATLAGGAIVSTVVSGYTGAGFVDFVAAGGESVEWSVTVPSAGLHELQFRYALGGGASRPLQISVNGTVVNASFGFPPTGGFANWSTVSMTATLNAGVNTIRAVSIGSSGANLDNLTVTAN